MNAIEIKNLTFGYENPVLKDINLSVKEGEFVSIIGPNGVGKSTLIKCICNILEPQGIINIYGKSKSEYSKKDLAKIISYVPQSSGREFNFTVREFISLSRYPYAKPFASLGEEDYKSINRAMELTDTLKYANRQMNKLSGGERQKVLIASSIAQEAKVLLLDEPTTFLDSKHIKEVFNIIKKTRETSTVIMVTHELNAISISSRVIALKDGKIIFDDTPNVFYDNKVAERVFDTEFDYISQNDKKYIMLKA